MSQLRLTQQPRQRGEFQFGPKRLPCGGGSYLVLAFTWEREWAVVYYRARFVGDDFPKRFAITKSVLLDALRVLFGEAGEPFDADAVVDYIRSTSWGAPLRQLTARREPHPMPQDERLAEEHGYQP